MTKQINDYTVDELSAKINAIKAEREKTANALKRYEKELERREVGLPLGVPVEDNEPAHCHSTYMFNFNSIESQGVFSERLRGYVKALQEIAKGKPIDIEVLLPLLKKGWVAMDEDGDWYFFTNKPYVNLKAMDWRPNDIEFWKIRLFNLKPATDWKNSLMECGL